MVTLISRSLKRTARLFAGLLGILAVFQLVLVAVAGSYENAGTFDRLAALLPSFAQQALGVALASFPGMTMVGYFHPVVLMIVVQFAIYLATEPAGEIEWGLVDLVLARPLPRHWIVSRSLVVAAAGIMGSALAMGLGTWAGLALLAPRAAQWPSGRVMIVLLAHLMMVAWCFGTAALAAAGWARRRGAAQAPVAIAAVTLFLIEFLGSSWAPARPLARISPFHYYQGSRILAGTADTALDLAVLSAMALVGLVLAYWRFARRDL